MKKKCILYGNCQVIIYVYELLNNLPEFKKHYELISYINHDREQTKKLVNIDVNELKDCNVFIYQPLGESHGVYGTENLKSMLKDDCVKISFPYVYNSSFYTTYWEDASPRWTLQTLINCGWKNIMSLILEKRKINEILNLYDNGLIDFYFEERMNICMELLKEKDEICDIKVSDFILEHYKDKRLFVTQNHLTPYFNIWITNQILERLNFPQIPNEYSDTNILESNCVYDSYNLKFYNFSHDTNQIFNNKETKDKIISFYNHFSSTNYNMNDLIINKIIDDPEKFIDMPF